MSFDIGGILAGGGALLGGLFGASEAADSADKAAEAQAKIAQQELELAQEQWTTYKEQILPLELEASQLGISAQELAVQRGEKDLQLYNDFYAPLQEQFVTAAQEGIKPNYEEVARNAAIQTNRAFDTAEGTAQRNLERRGVRPGSGAEAGGLGDTSLARAATQAYVGNQAREAERARVEGENFNRMATALNRQPTSYTPSTSVSASGISPSAAIQGYNSAANIYGNQATMYGNAAAGGAQSAINLSQQAYDLYNRFVTPTPTVQTQPVNSYGGGGNYQNALNLQFQGEGYAEGGMVGSAHMLTRESYGSGGEINGPSGVDQVPATVKSPDGQMRPARFNDGEYVIPADVVRQVGTDPLDEIIMKARERKARPNPGAKSLSRRMH